MKQKQRITLLGMCGILLVGALLLAACGGGDSSSGSDPVDPPKFTTGTFTDARDGQSYKTVTIGTQTWMAENLNYADSAQMTNLKTNSWCYANSADSCAKSGRLYRWTGAMNIESSYHSGWASLVISSPHQGVCPAGWHIPTNEEWQTLSAYVEANNGDEGVGTSLKSIAGWTFDNRMPTGTDKFGFSGVPAGAVDYYGGFYLADSIGYFWSATVTNEEDVGVWHLSYNTAELIGTNHTRNYAFSVRCVEDTSSSSPASSSSVVSSSSIEQGSLTYGGQTYKTVVIGTQTWMAENLNYADSTQMTNLKGNSWCYENSADSCAKFGRLYTWTGAMNLDLSYRTGGWWARTGSTPHQGVCPAGWHLPTMEEWRTLSFYVDANNGEEMVGSSLRSIAGWEYKSDIQTGTDKFGFSGVPAGYWEYDGMEYDGKGKYFVGADSNTGFWSVTELHEDYAYDAYVWLLDYCSNSGLTSYDKDDAFSVRCVKD